MKQKKTHEGCIEQMVRLFKDFLYAPSLRTDKEGLIRLDDLEMQPDVQQQITELWSVVDSENLDQYTDIKGYGEDFYKLFGFNNRNVDYDRDVDPNIKIGSIQDELISAD